MRLIGDLRFVVACVLVGCEARSVTFSASNVMRGSVRSFAQPDVFGAWFRESKTPQRILDATPGLEKVEKVSQKHYKGYLAPVRFAWISVKSVIDFEVNCIPEKSSIVMSCDAGSITQTVEGTKYFADIISKMTPSVISSSKFEFNRKSGELTNSVDLKVSFDLPAWFPVPSTVVEKSGSKTISKKNEKEFGLFFNKFQKMYEQDAMKGHLDKYDKTAVWLH